MTASQRQLEFLKTLATMTSEAGGPVHYAELARRMNVSPWTAYDMLRRLAKGGQVEPSYAVSGNRLPGRSQVLFAPTPAGLNLLDARRRMAEAAPALPGGHGDAGAGTAGGAGADEWTEIRRHFIGLWERARSSPEAVRETIWRELKSEVTPLRFCAGMLLFLVLCLEAVAAAELPAARLVLSLSPRVKLGLLLFLGFSVRALTGVGDQDSRLQAASLARLTERFQDSFERLDESLYGALRQLLNDFLVIYSPEAS